MLVSWHRCLASWVDVTSYVIIGTSFYTVFVRDWCPLLYQRQIFSVDNQVTAISVVSSHFCHSYCQAPSCTVWTRRWNGGFWDLCVAEGIMAAWRFDIRSVDRSDKRHKRKGWTAPLYVRLSGSAKIRGEDFVVHTSTGTPLKILYSSTESKEAI